MSDDQIIEDALADLVRKSGMKIRKDDPILLNAMVIQTMFREQVEINRLMGDELIRSSGVAVDETIGKYAKLLTENAVAQEKNAAIFLDAFREILAKQAAEKRDMENLADALYDRIKGRITGLLVAQIVIMGLIASGTALILLG